MIENWHTSRDVDGGNSVYIQSHEKDTSGTHV